LPLLKFQPSYILVNKANLVHNFSYYVYFFSVHVSGDYVPIIRINDSIYVILVICHSVWMTVCYAGWNSTLHSRQSSTQSDKYNKCRIDTVISPDDRHIVARNMYRKEINILRKIVHQVGFIYNIIFLV